MVSDSTRVTLLSRVRDPSDDVSWREFDEKYRELVLRYCRRRGLQESDAEDVRQDLMIRLSRAMPTFDYQPEVGRFRDYLQICVRNAISTHLSRQGTREERVSLREMGGLESSESDDLDDAWEAEWRNHHFRQAIAKARVAFERSTLEVFEKLVAGDRPVDVAASTGMGIQAVYKAKQRVRDFLHERILEQLADEEFPERV